MTEKNIAKQIHEARKGRLTCVTSNTPVTCHVSHITRMKRFNSSTDNLEVQVEHKNPWIEASIVSLCKTSHFI